MKQIALLQEASKFNDAPTFASKGIGFGLNEKGQQ
jgi:hypothetical protein